MLLSLSFKIFKILLLLCFLTLGILDGFDDQGEQSYDVFSEESDTESDESCRGQETVASSVSEKQKQHVKNVAVMFKNFFGDIGKTKPKKVAKETRKLPYRLIISLVYYTI